MFALSRSNFSYGSGGPPPAERPTTRVVGPPTTARGWSCARTISASLVCLFSILIIPGRCTAGPVSRGLLKGVVADSEGTSIRGAHVVVLWDPAGADVGLKSNVGIRHEVNLVTDRKGRFAAELPPGFYDVFVSATAFSPECRKVRINPGLTFVYKARLRVSPLITRELGDTMPK
jgi:hypothetical protein